MKINQVIKGYYDAAIITETVNSVELLMALASHKCFSLHLIDGSGFSEREVTVTCENDEYYLVCQEYDDWEAVYSFRTTDLSEAWKRLKNYACETVLKPSEAYM